MPCSDGSGYAQLEFEASDLKKKLDVRADQLCRTLAFLEIGSPALYLQLPKDILAWHVQHKEDDRRREELELRQLENQKKIEAERITKLERDFIAKYGLKAFEDLKK